MKELKDITLKKITVVSKCPYTAGLVYDKYKDARGQSGIVVVVSGEMCFEFPDGRVKKLKSGEAALFSEYAAYKVHNISGADVMHYSVNFLCTESGVFEKENYFKCTSPERVYEKCDLIEKFWSSGDVMSGLRAISLLYELTAILFEERVRCEIGTNNYERIVLLKEYIDGHLDERLDIEFLAQKCLMSKTNFRRLFARVYGTSPIEYLIRRRLVLATMLIFESRLEICEISARCGFTRTAYFCDMFKKRTGFTPTALRKSCVEPELVLKAID